MSYGEGAPNTSPLFRFDCSYYSHTYTPDSDSISQLLYGETYVEHILLTRGNAKILFCWPDKSIVSDRSTWSLLQWFSGLFCPRFFCKVGYLAKWSHRPSAKYTEINATKAIFRTLSIYKCDRLFCTAYKEKVIRLFDETLWNFAENNINIVVFYFRLLFIHYIYNIYRTLDLKGTKMVSHFYFKNINII